ncbi:MAG: hypothetical protein DSY37_03490 [Hyperthermus sp.]|nr:MAG: hypothetical protein DSY37_03490 [Hyperthermus sp.]
MRGVLSSIRRMIRGGEKEKCSYLVYGRRCIISLIYKGVINDIALNDNVCGISVTYRREPLGKALRRIRADYLAAEVQLERYRSASRENEYKLLLALEKALVDNPRAIKLQLYIHICDDADARSLRGIINYMQSMGCKFKRVCGFFRQSRTSRGYYVPLSWATESARTIAASLLPLLPPLTDAVPIGVETRLRTLVFLYLALQEGAQHTSIIGPTGKGKTTLLSIIAILSSILGHQAYIIDPKGDLENYIDYIDKHGVVKNKIIRLMEDNTMLVGFDVGSLVASETTGKTSVVIVDEAWSTNKRLIHRLVRVGRSSNIAVILATHDPNDLPSSIWNNISSIVIFGSRNQDYVDDIIRRVHVDTGLSDRIASLTTGEALLIHTWAPTAVNVKIISQAQASSMLELIHKSAAGIER